MGELDTGTCPPSPGGGLNVPVLFLIVKPQSMQLFQPYMVVIKTKSQSS